MSGPMPPPPDDAMARDDAAMVLRIREEIIAEMMGSSQSVALRADSSYPGADSSERPRRDLRFTGSSQSVALRAGNEPVMRTDVDPLFSPSGNPGNQGLDTQGGALRAPVYPGLVYSGEDEMSYPDTVAIRAVSQGNSPSQPLGRDTVQGEGTTRVALRAQVFPESVPVGKVPGGTDSVRQYLDPVALRAGSPDTVRQGASLTGEDGVPMVPSGSKVVVATSESSRQSVALRAGSEDSLRVPEELDVNAKSSFFSRASPVLPGWLKRILFRDDRQVSETRNGCFDFLSPSVVDTSSVRASNARYAERALTAATQEPRLVSPQFDINDLD